MCSDYFPCPYIKISKSVSISLSFGTNFIPRLSINYFFASRMQLWSQIATLLTTCIPTIKHHHKRQVYSTEPNHLHKSRKVCRQDGIFFSLLFWVNGCAYFSDSLEFLGAEKGVVEFHTTDSCSKQSIWSHHLFLIGYSHLGSKCWLVGVRLVVLPPPSFVPHSLQACCPYILPQLLCYFHFNITHTSSSLPSHL